MQLSPRLVETKPTLPITPKRTNFLFYLLLSKEPFFPKSVQKDNWLVMTAWQQWVIKQCSGHRCSFSTTCILTGTASSSQQTVWHYGLSRTCAPICVYLPDWKACLLSCWVCVPCSVSFIFFNHLSTPSEFAQQSFICHDSECKLFAVSNHFGCQMLFPPTW